MERLNRREPLGDCILHTEVCISPDRATRGSVDTERTPRARGPVPVRSFAVQAAVVLALFTTLVFVGIYWRTQALLEAALHDEASSYIDLIVDARAWNARHGGVWVLKTDGVQSNPFLRALGVEPDTQTVAGTWMTLRNPSAMTVEISRIDEAGPLADICLAIQSQIDTQ